MAGRQDTRIIRLPSRADVQTAIDRQHRPEQHKDLVALAARVDPELAAVISNWPRLARGLKDAMLAIAASGR